MGNRRSLGDRMKLGCFKRTSFVMVTVAPFIRAQIGNGHSARVSCGPSLRTRYKRHFDQGDDSMLITELKVRTHLTEDSMRPRSATRWHASRFCKHGSMDFGISCYRTEAPCRAASSRCNNERAIVENVWIWFLNAARLRTRHFV